MIKVNSALHLLPFDFFFSILAKKKWFFYKRFSFRLESTYFLCLNSFYGLFYKKLELDIPCKLATLEHVSTVVVKKRYYELTN